MRMMEPDKRGNDTLDELSFSHIFDYNAIEQIANGLEKMVQSWSSRPDDNSNNNNNNVTSVSAAVVPTAAATTGTTTTTTTTPTTSSNCSSSEINTNASEALKNFAKVLDRSNLQQGRSRDSLDKEYVKVEAYNSSAGLDTPQIRPAFGRSSLASRSTDKESGKKSNNSTVCAKENGREKKAAVDKKITNRVEEVIRRSVACRSRRSVRSHVSSSPERRTSEDLNSCGGFLPAEDCLGTRLCCNGGPNPAANLQANNRQYLRRTPSNKLSPTPIKPPFEDDDMQNLCSLSDVEEAACNYVEVRSNGNASIAYDDTFVTSSTYWRVEPPESLERSREEKLRQQDCSFVNDALYERADFSTSYEERPLKRKKEMVVEVLRNSSYDSELVDNAPLDDLALAPPPLALNSRDDRSSEQAKRKHTPSSHPRSLPDDDSKEMYKKKVEELQIALLECAAEYEVKMVEMEMKMLQLKSKYQMQEQEPLPSVRCEKEWATRRLENYRKHNIKLQREKETLVKEVADMRKKERQIDLLRKNLEDSLQKVNYLQREMVKKEEELVDSQLKEKEAKAHLYQVEAALQQAEASKIDHGGALSLLTAVNQWFQGVKRASLVKYDPGHQLQIQQYEDALSKLMEEYLPQQRSTKKIPQLGYIDWDALTPGEQPQTDSLEINREVQALQDELERLACRRSTF